MANPSTFQVTPNSALVESTEFNFCNLFLHQMYAGDNTNQSTIIERSNPEFGLTAVNNWAISEGVGPDAKLVARAKGVHMNTVEWYNSFIIVFETERFKGSTLLVMGASVGQEGGEWGIVGGTGEFSMARGIIKREVHEKINGGEIQALSMHGFFTKKSFPPRATKGPWGGSGGSEQNIAEKPRRLESVTIRSGFVIDSLAFSYVDQGGQRKEAGPWGGNGGHTQKIQLDPTEFVKEVSGTIDKLDTSTVISSLKLVTNMKTYGPFGREKGTPFSSSLPEDKNIVGFSPCTWRLHRINHCTIPTVGVPF